MVAVSKVFSGLREGEVPGAPGAAANEEEENREGDALFDEALRVRRRMRMKTSDPARMDNGGGDKVAERIRLLRHIIVEEEERMLEDEEGGEPEADGSGSDGGGEDLAHEDGVSE